LKVEHDYNRRAEAKPMGKGVIYLVIAIAVVNALLIMPAFYILN
jgi:hypothetical protein